MLKLPHRRTQVFRRLCHAKRLYPPLLTSQPLQAADRVNIAALPHQNLKRDLPDAGSRHILFIEGPITDRYARTIALQAVASNTLRAQHSQTPSKGIARMGRVIFKNPNEPKQPTEGVYRWSYIGKDRTEIPFYVGRSADRWHGPVGRASTLSRGVSELRRGGSLSSSEGHRTLDPDFIVGTMIMYLTGLGFDCVWEHVRNDPSQEKNLCHKPEPNPILQDGNAGILKEFKLTRPDRTPWNSKDPQHVTEAEERLYGPFAQVVGM